MNTPSHDPLDSMFAELPREAQPSRDLWREIKAEIAADAPHAVRPWHQQRWLQLAAAVVLVVGSSVVTFFVVERSMQAEMQQQVVLARNSVTDAMDPVLKAMPVRFDGHEGLGKGYEEARAERRRSATSRSTFARTTGGRF
jgi:hypothetical protein